MEKNLIKYKQTNIEVGENESTQQNQHYKMWLELSMYIGREKTSTTTLEI